MKYQLQLFYIIHIFQISLHLSEKNEFDKKELEKHLRSVKLKVLNSNYKNSPNISKRQMLKLLHLISFEDHLEQNTLNRATFNTLELLKLTINEHTCKIIPNTPLFSNSFNQTWGISIMYNLFKNKR
jgi:hypothetical protein